MKHYLRFMITLILTTVWCMGGVCTGNGVKIMGFNKIR